MYLGGVSLKGGIGKVFTLSQVFSSWYGRKRNEPIEHVPLLNMLYVVPSCLLLLFLTVTNRNLNKLYTHIYLSHVALELRGLFIFK